MGAADRTETSIYTLGHLIFKLWNLKRSILVSVVERRMRVVAKGAA